MSDDELAAVVAAAAALLRRGVRAVPPRASRWRLADRLARARVDDIRAAAHTPWRASGRLRG